MEDRTSKPPLVRRRRRLLTALSGAVLIVCAGLSAAGSPAQDLQGQLEATESKLSQAKRSEGVLTTEISRYSSRISELEGNVADLRSREAILAADLEAKQAELAGAQAELERVRSELKAAVDALEARLVAIYKSSDPDMLGVVLSADGFDDLLQRAEYLEDLQNQDAAIVETVRELRDRAVELVTTVKAARDAIAARKQELEVMRTSLESRLSELSTARGHRKQVLQRVRSRRQDLEGDLTKISEQIAKQLGSIPAGPIRAGSGMFIWPVDGTITSGFGPRAMHGGETHEGLDIAVPGGTGIRAAAAGTTRIAGPNGGYGNYTCVDHGGGLSTCYAHQAEILVSVGQRVSQGQIIGRVGCTGSCTGDHVHFEVRENGQAVDPLGYL